LNFSVGPNEMLWSKADFGPLAEDLAKAISLPVKLCEARSHADAVEALRSSQIQLGWFCNRSAVAAIDSANGEIFAEIDGSHGDKTSIVVHQDGPIAKDLDRILAQSKASGKPMRFPSWLAGLEPLFDHAKEITFLQDQPLSTAAFLSSHFFFTENGIDPQTAFKKYGVGTLQSNALAVADGTADAAVFKYGALDIFARRYPAKGAQLRVICRGPGGGNDPLVWRADLPNDLKNKIRNFFLDYAKSEANRSKLAALKWKGFLPASNRHVNPYRYLLALTEKAELEKDGQIPAADKQVRLAELTQRIQELKTLGGWHIPHRKPIDYSKPLDSQLNPSPQTPATSAK
jgi:phosphonate transport system substrate-binding protein